MDAKSLNFREGDRVIHHYGIKGEFLQEAIVGRVYKTGRFKIEGSETQFRQTGWQAAEDGTWGQEWVEPWTPEAAQKLLRHKLELRAISAAKIFLENISEIESHKLEYVSAYLEDVNRKTIGE